jgi:uncharacterized protein YbcI
MPESERLVGGQLQTAISNAVVRVVAEYTGRGPTRARTILHGDWVFVSLEGSLTKGELRLSDMGDGEFVRESRRRYQVAMRAELTAEVEALVGRRAVAFFSDNHLDPDIALEAVMLEPEPSVATEG